MIGRTVGVDVTGCAGAVGGGTGVGDGLGPSQCDDRMRPTVTPIAATAPGIAQKAFFMPLLPPSWPVSLDTRPYSLPSSVR